MTSTPHLQTRAQFTAAYDNSAAVPEAAGLLEGFLQRSQSIYAARPCERNIPYGPGVRQTFDWFPAMTHSESAPVFVFLHGGYWQWRSKEDFACVAAGPLAAGFHVVLGEYTLAPQARMPEIVAEIGRLLDTLQAHTALGCKPGAPRIVLAGHSAGGHLAAMHRSHPAVSGVLAVSGLFELEPIRRGALNDALQLTDAEVASCSPLRRVGPGCPMHITVGGAELPALIVQSEVYARALGLACESADFRAIPGRNHFDILLDIEREDGTVLQFAKTINRDAVRCADMT